MKTSQLFIPQCIISKILGILPYTIKNNNPNLSKISLCYSLFCFSLYVILASNYYRTSSLSDGYQYKTVVVTVFIRNSVYTIIVLLTFISIGSAFRKIIFGIQTILKNDKKLIELGLGDEIKKSDRKVLKKIAFFNCLVFLFGTMTSIVVATNGIIHASFPMVYPRLICCNNTLTFFVLAMVLEERYRIINFALVREKVKSRNLSNYPIETHFYNKILTLIEIYKSCFKICKIINTIFSFYFLSFFAIAFFCVVCDSYLSTDFLVSGSFLERWNLALVLVKHLIVYSTEMFLICKRSYQLCYQVSQYFLYIWHPGE